MGNPETKLTQKIQKHIESLGNMQVAYHGGEYARRGVPDLMCTFNGLIVGIEIKVKNNKPQPHQSEFMRRMREDYNAVATWVNEDNWEEVVNKIHAFTSQINWRGNIDKLNEMIKPK